MFYFICNERFEMLQEKNTFHDILIFFRCTCRLCKQYISFLCSTRLHLFDQKYCKNSNVVNYYFKCKIYFFYFNIV